MIWSSSQGQLLFSAAIVRPPSEIKDVEYDWNISLNNFYFAALSQSLPSIKFLIIKLAKSIVDCRLRSAIGNR